MKVIFEQTVEDIQDLSKNSLFSNRIVKIGAIVFGVVILFNIIGSFAVDVSIGDVIQFLIPVIVLVGLWVFFFKFFQKKMILRSGNKEMMIGSREIDFEEDGISLKTPVTESTFKWEAITKLKQSDKNYFLYLGTAQAIIVPKRAFEDDFERNEFEQLITRRTGFQLK